MVFTVHMFALIVGKVRKHSRDFVAMRRFNFLNPQRHPDDIRFLLVTKSKTLLIVVNQNPTVTSDQGALRALVDLYYVLAHLENSARNATFTHQTVRDRIRG